MDIGEKAALKTTRSEVRADHAERADAEIAECLPVYQQRFTDAMMEGCLIRYEAEGRFSRVRKLRILDFDCECRPMAFFGGDFVTKEITAIAWKFIGQKSSNVWLLTPSETLAHHRDKRREGIERFIEAYDRADMVTGHYIRGFDLPLVNAHCIYLGLPPLRPKYAHDTKGDLITLGGISKSQENLAAHFDAGKKEGMNTSLWETANSLVREGRAETRRRVLGDIVQHEQFREALIRAQALRPPKVWTSGARQEEYIA